MKTDTAPFIHLDDYTPPDFLTDHLDLEVRLDGPRTTARGRWTCRRNPARCAGPNADKLHLDAADYSSVEVRVNGLLVEPQKSAAALTLPAPNEDTFEVEVVTVLDPDANKALSGLYRTSGVYCTQCEAEGFRRIIPFFDRPDVLARYTVRLIAPRDACPILLSNGNLREETSLDEGWHQVVWHDPHPKPSYLFALVGGKLDKLPGSFTTSEGRSVDLAIYVEPGKAPQAEFALECLKRSMRWDEEKFGRTYDLDVFNIVAVSDFNLGAMENKGLNIFNDKYILASPETATDEDYRNVDAIIAHEYFHNWTGNRITCRDWFQLCLKEGLTVFRDQEYSADVYDRTLKRIADVRMLWAHQFPEDSGPLAHPVRPARYKEINNFYTATVYEKGAEIVRMMALWLGEERFRAAMDRYFDTFDGQAVRIEEFIASMEAEAGDLGPWPDFMRWYTQSGTPSVEVEVGQEDGTLTCHFQQKTAPTADQPEKVALPIPCAFTLVDKSGLALPLNKEAAMATGGRFVASSGDGGIFLLEEASGALVLDSLSESARTISLFQGFSAPVTTTITGISRDDKLFLAGRDPSRFNRWLHLQDLVLEALVDRYKRLSLDEAPTNEEPLFDAILQQLVSVSNQSDDLGLRAAALTLPVTSDLVRAIGSNVDPEIVLAARDGFSAALYLHGREAFNSALETLGLEDDGLIEPQSAARRSLLGALLDHVAQAKDQDALDALALTHKGSRGMTMRIRTLGLLIRSGHAQAEEALDAFEDRFGDNPLAMDKWLSIQATSYRENAAAVVERLMQHRAFSLQNPNRARALLGAFASGNLAGFHHADGSGYALVARAVAQIDQENPQLAARLCAAFRSWKQFGPQQREKAQEVLLELRTGGAASRDVADIVDRTLES